MTASPAIIARDQRIARLHRRGFSSEMIADAMNLSKSHVDNILSGCGLTRSYHDATYGMPRPLMSEAEITEIYDDRTYEDVA